MSKKSKKKNAQQGTYALCITVGLILGFGLGAIVNNVLILTIIGAFLGFGAGYYFNHHKTTTKH